MAKALDSGTLSVFCDGIAMMLAAGIQTEEAVFLLANNMEETPFKQTCRDLYACLTAGETLGSAMEKTGAFPDYALRMVRAGEYSGRLESVLRNLAIYYSEEDRLFTKMRSAILYPAALLAVMTVILVFTVAVILPVFTGVYDSIAGSLATSTYAYVRLSMGIGYAALALMALSTIAAIVLAVMSNGSSRSMLFRIMGRLPISADAMYHMALSRFTAALATFVSAGVQGDRAMEEAIKMIDHPRLRKRAQITYASMTNLENPKSLSQAIYDNELFDPIYGRMMLVSGRSGSTEQTLQSLSNTFFDDAVVRIDALIDSVEPSLAAFLTLSVGATLIAVMLPLIGIMGSIS